MGVYRRGKNWIVSVHSPALDKQIWGGTFKTKRDADIRNLELERAVKLGYDSDYLKPRDIALDDLVQEFARTAQVRESTRKDYERVGRAAMAFFGEKKSVASLTQRDVEAWVAQMARTYKPSSVNVYLRVFKLMLRAALRWGLIRTLPIQDRIPTPQEDAPEERVRVLTPEQHQRLTKAVPELYHTMFHVWPLLGLRKGEMLGLQWADIDFKNRTVRVQRQLTKSGEYAKLKSRRSNRVVHMTRDVARALGEWKLRQGETKTEAVFTNRAGNVIDSKRLYEIWHKSVADAGLPAEITPHVMRHTFASWLLQAGASLVEVQTQMGHAQAATTLNLYGHLVAGGSTTAEKLEAWQIDRRARHS